MDYSILEIISIIACFLVLGYLVYSTHENLKIEKRKKLLVNLQIEKLTCELAETYPDFELKDYL